MALIDPSLKGKWIKLSVGEQPSGFVQLSTIARAVKATDAQGEHIVIHRKGGRPPLRYRGRFVDRVKKKLEDEGIGEV